MKKRRPCSCVVVRYVKDINKFVFSMISQLRNYAGPFLQPLLGDLSKKCVVVHVVVCVVVPPTTTRSWPVAGEEGSALELPFELSRLFTKGHLRQQVYQQTTTSQLNPLIMRSARPPHTAHERRNGGGTISLTEPALRRTACAADCAPALSVFAPILESASGKNNPESTWLRSMDLT